MTTPQGFNEFQGDLFRDGENKAPIRTKWQWHFSRTSKPKQVAACLRAGPNTWPGCYPLYFITRDGAALCFECVRKEWRQVVWDFIHKASTGWRIEACEVNYEGCIHCDHCSREIESAYGTDND